MPLSGARPLGQGLSQVVATRRLHWEGSASQPDHKLAGGWGLPVGGACWWVRLIGRRSLLVGGACREVGLAGGWGLLVDGACWWMGLAGG